ncbi:MAG: xanthine dehydrogenase family protein molybdopterin-binding subunit [Actinomycetota bacterium]
MTKGRFVGAGIRRIEAPRFLSGRGRYVADLPATDMLHLAFVRSRSAHSVLDRVDVSAAAEFPGVAGVVTAEDLSGRVYPIVTRFPHPSWQGSAYPVLAEERMRFAGQAVAAVLASSRAVAEDAAEQVVIHSRPLPVLSDVAAALDPSSKALHPGWQGNLFLRQELRAGDVEEAFRLATGTVRLQLTHGRVAGVPLEPRACLALVEAGRLTLWTSSQTPQIVRAGVAMCLGIDQDRLRVVAPDVGGGFGVKQQLFPEEVLVSLLALETGRPVRWVEDGAEQLLASVHAREQVHEVEAAYADDGKVVGVRVRILVDCGAYSMFPSTAALDGQSTLAALPGPYAIPALEAEVLSVATNKCPVGPYRGVGRPAACFTMERAMDAVAARLGRDPVEIRAHNLISPDRLPYRSATGQVYGSGSYRAALDEVCRVGDYEGWRHRARASQGHRLRLGVGVACMMEQAAFVTARGFRELGVPLRFVSETVSVALGSSGKVTVDVPTHSHGQGHETVVAQVVADELGTELHDVAVRFGDTDLSPQGIGTFNSRSAVVAAGGAQQAARAVGAMVVRLAGELLGVRPDDLEIQPGGVGRRDSGAALLSLVEIVSWASTHHDRLPSGVDPRLRADWTFEAPQGTGTVSNAAHLAVVELDAETGGLRVLRYVVVEDAGRILNPRIVEGQIRGAVAQGLGHALLEELQYDREGHLQNGTPGGYITPRARDVPPIEIHHLETVEPNSPNGAKGIGEGGAVAAPAAIAAAIDQALEPAGYPRVLRLPVTQRRLLDLLATRSDPLST